MKIVRLAALAAFVSCGLVGTALAERPDPRQEGYLKCIDWCYAHNKTVASYRVCSSQCKRYWRPPHPVTGTAIE